MPRKRWHLTMNTADPATPRWAVNLRIQEMLRCLMTWTVLCLVVSAGCRKSGDQPTKTFKPPPESLKNGSGSVQTLDALLEPIRKEHDLPALAAAVVRDGKLIAEGAVGNRRAGHKE